MKKLGRMACLAMVAVIAVPSLTTTAAAQDALPPPVYPVIHDKAWYDDPSNVAPFTWTDEAGVVHENKVSDEATNPLHIIALLSYVYTNPKIPGSNYAIPDSAGMENIYQYIPQDFSTYNGKPVRTNNLSTKIDYTRHVRNNYYTGDVQYNEGNHDDYLYELGLDANRNGLQLWANNNPFFTKWEQVTEYIKEDNSSNISSGPVPTSRPIVDQPEEHGLTVFLVKMKDGYAYNSTDHKPALGTASTWDTSLKYGVTTSLYNSIASEIESVRLLTNAVRVEDADSKTNHNSGTLYSVNEPNMNRFYFIAKGTPRQSVKMPTKPLFEEFSPISSLLNGWEMNFYNELMEGKIYTMMHDCSSVPEQAHSFSMHGLSPDASHDADHRDIEGVCLWVPDYRMEHWTYQDYYNNYNYKPASEEGFGRDLFKLYGSDNKAVYRVIRYFNYNPQHAPSLALYTCKLAASAQPYSGTSQYEHPYNVKLDWSTTVSRIAGSNYAIPEDFDVYLVEDGVRKPDPLVSFVYGQNGYCQVNVTNADLSQGEAPASKYRTYEHNYQVPQYEDHGYWLTYQVFARVHKDGDQSESFFNVLSNTDRVWIPPYSGPGAVKLNIEVNTSSRYDKAQEINRYVNTIKINNNPENPLKMGDIFARPNGQGWNPETNAFENPPQGAAWQYADNNLGSEIIVYRYNTKNPTEKTQVARVYFNNIVGERFRFAVGRDNQASSAQEGEYVYTDDNLEGQDGNARPWMQSCDASSYSAQGDFPFAHNHGYALGTTSKGDPNYYYDKGLMVTDVFEVSTASNDHPEQYGYVAEFHKYSNLDAETLGHGYRHVTYASNQATVDVYKSNSEASEFTFTKDEVDNGDTMHEIETGYMAGLTVNNMLYDDAIISYYLYDRDSDGPLGSYAMRDTPNNYLVYSNGKKVGEPSQFQSVVTIPDESREDKNLDAVYYVPVITAKLPERGNWMTGDGNTTAASTYGSDFHGTGNTIVELAYDKEHKLYEAIYKAYLGLDEDAVIADADWGYGSDIEHTLITNGAENNGDWYGHFMTISSDMSPNLEVYGVRVWRVREKDANGAAEDKLVNEWFLGDNMSIIGTAMPSYFVVAVNEAGKLSVELKDIYKGPDMETFKQNSAYRPEYIVHYYGRVKSLEEPTSGDVNTLSVTPRAQDDQAKVYYVSEFKYRPTINEIPTGINGVMQSVQVESVEYIDVMGRVSSRPFKGLNIVVTRYADGTIITTKQVKN